MRYFFDESGNWQEIENEEKRFVICGMVENKKESVEEIEEEFKFFIARNRLEVLHATDIRDLELKKELWKIVLNFLKDEKFRIMAYVMNANYFLSKTQKSPDEIYSDIAAELISEIAFGDENIDIEYDLKFHYSYTTEVVKRVLNKSFNPRSDIFHQMERNFLLRKEIISEQKNRIKGLLFKRNPFSSTREIYDFINNIRNIQSYLWEEFRLKVEKSAIIKEVFKQKALSNLKSKYELFGLDFKDIKINIDYKNKFTQSAGVQVADILSNLIYFNGLKVKDKEDKVVKEIYELISLKEVK